MRANTEKSATEWGEFAGKVQAPRSEAEREQGWRELYERFIRPLARRLRAAGHPDPDIEEILSSVTMRFLDQVEGNLFSFDGGEGGLRSWLRRLTLYEVRAHCRLVRRHKSMPFHEDMAIGEDRGLRALFEEDELRLLKDVLAAELAKLEEPQRMILEAAAEHTVTDSELAKRLNSQGLRTPRGSGWTQSNVAQTRLRLRRHLRARIAGALESHE